MDKILKWLGAIALVLVVWVVFFKSDSSVQPLVDAVNRVDQNVGAVNANVTQLGGRVDDINDRLSALETPVAVAVPAVATPVPAVPAAGGELILVTNTATAIVPPTETPTVTPTPTSSATRTNEEIGVVNVTREAIGFDPLPLHTATATATPTPTPTPGADDRSASALATIAAGGNAEAAPIIVIVEAQPATATETVPATATTPPTATAQPTATMSPTAVPATAQPAPTNVSYAAVPQAQPAVSCMTDSDVMSLYGFAANEIIRTDAPWDSCKWNRQNLPSTINFVLQEGWGLTYTDANGNVWVTMGENQWITARGFTLRQPGNQFLSLGPTGYLNKEWTYGFALERGTATFSSCPDTTMSPLVTLTAEQTRICTAQGTVSASAGPVQSAQPTSRPTVVPQTGTTGPSEEYSWNTNCFNTSWLSSNIGGAQANWTTPDWDGGAAVYKSKGTFVSLRYPGTGRLNVWITAATEINASNASLLNGKMFDEASFHCAQPE